MSFFQCLTNLEARYKFYVCLPKAAFWEGNPHAPCVVVVDHPVLSVVPVGVEGVPDRGLREVLQEAAEVGQPLASEEGGLGKGFQQEVRIKNC